MVRPLELKKAPLIMGILNVTPDSFYDGGRHFDRERAIKRGIEMIEEGADIIDIGGESTRPYSEATPLDVELERVIPVIEGIRAYSKTIPISIDTYKAQVVREAFRAGADIANDISGFQFDPDMAKTVAELDMYAIIMHIKGTPRNMQQNPHYDNVVGEIKSYLVERIDYAKKHGVDEGKIIIDPGIGFGKRIEDNLRIIKSLKDFKELGRPILIGTSMKSFIGRITEAEGDERKEGTYASVAISVWNGADIVRVHDVKGNKKVLKLVSAIMDVQ
ncbi:MAG: dihydropteroate synthase [Syntrophorhabdaceae bacterium]|nr:dihydropteroate synthase [Syntrophorhabdaceae bacterium]